MTQIIFKHEMFNEKKYKLRSKRYTNYHRRDQFFTMRLARAWKKEYRYTSLVGGKSMLLCGKNLAISEKITILLSLAQQIPRYGIPRYDVVHMHTCEIMSE